MHRSHLTQELQNYFDVKDPRVREVPYTIDAQLLNLAAVELEDLDLRLQRESGRALRTVALNIDNRGVYFGVSVPAEVDLSDPTVVGKNLGVPTTLVPFDDRLPQPTRVEVDSTIDPVPLTDPVLLTLIGEGDNRTQVYTVQTAVDLTLPVPNRLSFWLDQLDFNPISMDIFIEGVAYPEPAWHRQRTISTETLQINGQGFFATSKRWSSISKIVVRGLPDQARLRLWSMPFAMPSVADMQRPYTHPLFRDIKFPRYWQVSSSEGLLKELFMAAGFTGLDYVQSYSLPEDLVDVAVEPWTNGLFAISASNLYYLDRRQPLPDHLESTGLTQEPCYGLQVEYDVTQPGPNRFVLLTPMPYGKADKIFRHRFSVQDPIGSVYAITPDGTLIAYSGSAGWRNGAPKAMTFPVVKTGTYVFTLECMDTDAIIAHDSFPYPNLALSPLKTLPIDTKVAAVKGIAFDSFGQLWIWTGSYMVAIKLHYDAYVLDETSRHIFATDSFDTIEIS